VMGGESTQYPGAGGAHKEAVWGVHWLPDDYIHEHYLATPPPVTTLNTQCPSSHPYPYTIRGISSNLSPLRDLVMQGPECCSTAIDPSGTCSGDKLPCSGSAGCTQYNVSGQPDFEGPSLSGVNGLKLTKLPATVDALYRMAVADIDIFVPRATTTCNSMPILEGYNLTNGVYIKTRFSLWYRNGKPYAKIARIAKITRTTGSAAAVWDIVSKNASQPCNGPNRIGYIAVDDRDIVYNQTYKIPRTIANGPVVALGSVVGG
jgi:hypothetical protein